MTIAAVATFALATSALAQDQMMMKDNGSPTGEMMMTESMDQSMMEMAMKNATEVEDGTILHVWRQALHGGKI